jgi:hypothetical protein
MHVDGWQIGLIDSEMRVPVGLTTALVRVVGVGPVAAESAGLTGSE